MSRDVFKKIYILEYYYYNFIILIKNQSIKFKIFRCLVCNLDSGFASGAIRLCIGHGNCEHREGYALCRPPRNLLSKWCIIAKHLRLLFRLYATVNYRFILDLGHYFILGVASPVN